MYLSNENKCLVIKQNLIDILPTLLIQYRPILISIAVCVDLNPSDLLVDIDLISFKIAG